MSKAPAFQFYPDKWIADTKRLSWKAKGLYHELLCAIWMQFQDTCSIPNDDAFIALEIGCSEADWAAAKSEIMNPHRPILVITETNRLFSEGLHKEAEKQEERRNRLRINGAKGGRPKNQKVYKIKATDGNSENQNKSLPSPSPSPSPSPTVVVICKSKGGLQECIDFGLELGLLADDGDWFFHKCEGNGWNNGGRAIKDWKATMRAWKTANYFPSQKEHQSSVAPPVPSGIDKTILRDRLADAKKKLESLISQYDSHQSWSPTDIAERKRLRDVIKELELRLEAAV